MPIIQGVKRKNPLDINRNVTIGVAFPLDETNMFTGTPTTKEQVKSNLLNLLLTKKGERINHPGFGIGLQNFLFENNIDSEAVNEEIHNQIQFYIPEITLSDTQINFNPDEHTITIKIIYEFNLDSTQDAILITV
tara:strand:+ start:78 stop:482 length:405 start_codon:yes stop_codon:yes gene_type:complete